MTEILTVVVQLSALVFVVGSMMAMGLSLTIPQITKPLKNGKLLVMALVANFILVPLLAYVLTLVFGNLFGGFTEDNTIAFLLLATAAGAPFLPKLAQMARGNVAYSVGLMTLLMVVSVFFLPIVLPLLLPGVQVDAAAIARSLVITMLIPLAIGLFIRARYEESADHLQPIFGQASNTALLLMMGVLLLMNVKTILGTVGTGVLLAGVIFYLGSFIIGFLLGFGADEGTKSVLALGTGQRNLSAAFVVAAGNFSDRPDVIISLVVLAIVDLVVMLPLGGEIGKRAAAKTQNS
ncbi:MAG: bile acid:sodium symporter family protein [Chloroflexi bacterium]|nr:bile acid:sodium symporter family protein [Chloroflexota bacterium]